MDEVASRKSILGGMLDVWPKIGACIAGVTIVLSLAFNWSYSHIAQIHAFQYMDINDYISSIMGWLPDAFVGFVIGGIFWGINTRLLTSALCRIFPVLNRNTTHSVTKKSIYSKISIYIMPFFTAIMGAAIPFFFMPSRSYFYIYVFFMIFVSFHLTMMRFFNYSKVVAAIFLFNIFFCESLMSGEATALYEFSVAKGNATVILRNGEKIYNSIVVRRLDKGVLLRVIDENKVTFIPWTAVDRLSVSDESRNLKPRICRMFRVRCDLGYAM
ncbi:MAG: hypothetical protein P4M02_04730 [Clostridia bacterium]|nr:hypothetical protein [Clostridia bacterium]